MRIQYSILVDEALSEANAPNFAQAIVRGFRRIGQTSKDELYRPNLTPYMRWEMQSRGPGLQLFPGGGKWPFVEAGTVPHPIQTTRAKVLNWGGEYATYSFHPGTPAHPWLAPGFERGASDTWLPLMVNEIAEEFPK